MWVKMTRACLNLVVVLGLVVALAQVTPVEGNYHMAEQAPAASEASIVIKFAPTSVKPGGMVIVEWQVNGKGKITHTGVHFDTRPGNPQDFRSYSKFTPDFASISPAHDAPREYKASFDAPSSGTIYYVVHAVVSGKHIYNPGGEMTITITEAGAPVPAPAPKEVRIAIQAAPERVTPEQRVTITWMIEGSGKVSHTALHWDTKPGNPADFKTYAKATPDFASLSPPDDLPKQYTVTLDAPSTGTVYYVIHAIVDGKNIYNPDGERKIDIIVREASIQDNAQPLGGIFGIDAIVLVGVGVAIAVMVVAVVVLSKRKASIAQ